jgi:hypothetical protein
MATFQADLEALARIHAELLGAVAETDVDRIEPLVARRGDLLASLALTFAAASPGERESWRPAITTLAREDSELNERFRDVRDQLAAELARASAHPGTPAAAPTTSRLNLRA